MALANPSPLPLDLCPTCLLPKEYCPLGPHAAKCQKASQPTQDPQADASHPQEPATETTLAKDNAPPRNKKPAEPAKKITVSLFKKNKRHVLTKIVGLSEFGINPQDVSKVLARKFSVGCSVEKAKDRSVDCVNLQGSFVQEVIGVLGEQFNIPQEAIKVE